MNRPTGPGIYQTINLGRYRADDPFRPTLSETHRDRDGVAAIKPAPGEALRRIFDAAMSDPRVFAVRRERRS